MAEAAAGIKSLINYYRHSSALRFSLFLNIDTELMTTEHSGVLYKVETKLQHDSNHYDYYFVSENGAIASTCADYAEMGFYNRHILAMYINGFIDLYPLYQCSRSWFDPRKYEELQSLNDHFSIKVLGIESHAQSFVYSAILSTPSLAYEFTRTAYDSGKD